MTKTKGGSESKEGTEVPRGLLARQCDALEAFELSDGLFDAGLPALFRSERVEERSLAECRRKHADLVHHYDTVRREWSR